VSYNNWDIPEDLFSITPINRDTVNNFIGRNSLVQKYSKLIESKNVRAVFEGEIGTGKTSLGNYIRFTQKNSFTTDMELMSQAHWGSKEFLLALQSAVITTCRKQNEYGELLKDELFNKILDRNSNIRISNYQGGFQAAIVGASFGKTDSISQPAHLDDQVLISELNEMLEKIKNLKAKNENTTPQKIRIIFQINNLDPGQAPFSEDSIVVFLNNIRDILTTAIQASFIINGATGIQALIQKSIRRLSPALIFEKIKPLSKQELIEAIGKRISNSGHKGGIPFDYLLIEALYNSTNGNFRETLGLMEDLATYFDSEEPLMNNIKLEDCYAYFFAKQKDELSKFTLRHEEITNKGKIIQILSKTPNLNVSEISKIISVKQGNTSTLLSDLESEGVIMKNKTSSSVECSLTPGFYFASIPFFKELEAKIKN
jgi:hypothetical protein